MKRKKNKNFDEIKELEIELFKLKYVTNQNKLQSESKDLNKIQVANKNLQEIEQEILVEYTGEFEIFGNLKVGDQVRQTHIGFRNIDGYGSYFNAIDQDYE